MILAVAGGTYGTSAPAVYISLRMVVAPDRGNCYLYDGVQALVPGGCIGFEDFLALRFGKVSRLTSGREAWDHGRNPPRCDASGPRVPHATAAPLRRDGEEYGHGDDQVGCQSRSR